jgi:hypothetical protein
MISEACEFTVLFVVFFDNPQLLLEYFDVPSTLCLAYSAETCRNETWQFCILCVDQGVDAAYDAALCEYYDPYHHLVDLLVRVAVNQQCLSENVVNLSATVACEGVPLHMPYFAKLWYEIYMSESVDRRYVDMLCSGTPFIDYVAAVLLEERTSLNNPHIHQCFCNFFNRVRTAYFILLELGILNDDCYGNTFILNIRLTLLLLSGILYLTSRM